MFIEYQSIDIDDNECKLICECKKIMFIEIEIILMEEISNKTENK